MSEFFFGVSTVRPTRKAAKAMDRIAKRHGAYLVETDSPSYRRWYACPNRGEPFNGQTARAVLAETQAACSAREIRAACSALYGHLCDYQTGERIRHATKAERDQSRLAAQHDHDRGVFVGLGGKRVFVEE